MNALGKYWVIYYLVYLLCVALFVWQHWQDLLHGDNRIHLMAAGFGVSAGVASILAIVVEVVGRMVLLIPAAVKKLKEEGRQEGRQEGRREARQELNAEWEAWLRRRDESQANGQSFDEPPPSQRRDGRD